MGNKRIQVYFLKSEQYSKVGVTNTVQERISSLNVGNPNEIFLYHSIKMGSREAAYKLESAIHNLLKDKGRHKKGEWFDIRNEDIEQINEIIEKKLNRKNIKDNFLSKGFFENSARDKENESREIEKLRLKIKDLQRQKGKLEREKEKMTEKVDLYKKQADRVKDYKQNLAYDWDKAKKKIDGLARELKAERNNYDKTFWDGLKIAFNLD